MARRGCCFVPCVLGLLLNSLIGVRCDGELLFTLEPSDIVAVQEQPLMLHCQVDGIPPITTHWRRSGLRLTGDTHHTAFANGSLLIGHFQKAKPGGASDEGEYECMAQNPFGLVVSRKARVLAAMCRCAPIRLCRSEGWRDSSTKASSATALISIVVPGTGLSHRQPPFRRWCDGLHHLRRQGVSSAGLSSSVGPPTAARWPSTPPRRRPFFPAFKRDRMDLLPSCPA
ncbi:unnamed protein product [Arctogadus glacialis]